MSREARTVGSPRALEAVGAVDGGGWGSDSERAAWLRYMGDHGRSRRS